MKARRNHKASRLILLAPALLALFLALLIVSPGSEADAVYKIPTTNPAFTRGARVSGNFANVQASDNTYMRVREAWAGGVRYLDMSWNGWEVFSEAARSSLVDIQVELEGYQTNAGDSWYVRFYDYNAGAWDTTWYSLGSLPTAPDGNLQLALGDASLARTFLSATGQFRLRIADSNTVNGGADPTRTDMYIDLLRARFVYDIQPPVSSITSPLDQEQTNLSAYLIQGTSSDVAPDPSGVSSVEVSVDGGASWNPATPVAPGDYSTWSYVWSPIPAEGAYDIRSRALDGAGNLETPGPGVQLVVDWTPPAVASVTPAGGSMNIGVSANVQVEFLEANDMAAGTIDGSTFTLVDEEGTPISGTISYDSGSKTATFDPTADLFYGYSYTATITSGVTDLAGNQLPANHSWTFKTADILGMNLSDTYNRDGTPGGGAVSFGTMNPEGSPFVVGGGSPPYAVNLRVLSSTQWNLLVRATSDLVDNAQLPPPTIPISQLQWMLSGDSTWTPFGLVDDEVFQTARPRTAQPSGDEVAFDFRLDLNWEDAPGNYSTTTVFILLEQP